MKRPFLTLLVSLFVLASQGCWDYKEMENRAFVQMIGFDWREGKFEVVIHMFNTQVAPSGAQSSQGGEGQRLKPFRVLSARGDTVGEAINILSGQLYREIDFEHLRVIVIGEELARRGLDRIDFLDRDRKVPMNTLVTVTREPVGQILEANSPGTPRSSEFLEKALAHRGSRSNRAVAVYHWMVFYRLLESKFEDIYAPGVTARQYGINYLGTAVFKKARLAGWLDESETAYFNAIKQKNFIGPEIIAEDPRLPGGRGYLMLDQGQGRFGVRLRAGQPVLTFEAEIHARISGLPGADLKTLADQRRIARIFAESEEKRYRAVIERLQGLGSDPIGFGEKLRQTRPDHPALMDWPSAYRSAPVEVDIRMTITTYGRGK